ncbi:extracellular solute-binding protein [Actinomadura viridis]|uniref:Multiple sugar transport system substrate-binding protein n=1 Tax=Actinomadura viridis TaxID=58110 RepID=A0A931DSC2_9ACTN|nr:extracellular solute-binding protein [Actinomadura viridis]MBG6093868.1 multiple sugar transport system substrate-binding protein [Actinomadura viridis]
MHTPSPYANPSRRGALRLLGLTALGAAAAACAPSSGGSAGGDRDADHFTFTAWSLNEAAQKDAVQAIVDAYAKSGNVKIETAAYPYNDFLNQLVLKLRGGDVTGAIQLDVAWLGAVASMGRLADLGPQAAKGGYTDVALSGGKYQGKQYGLPWTTGSIGLIANTELLGKAGVKDLPATIEEFEEALRAVGRLGGGVVPYAASTKPAQLKDILPWIQTFGGTLVQDGRPTLDDDASVEAVAWYKKLYDQKLIAPDVDRFDARALFAQGKAAFYDDAPIAKGVIAKQARDPKLVEKIEPLSRPVLKSGDTPRAFLWGHLIIVVDGEGATKAADFAARTTSDTATAVDFFGKVAMPPSTTAALASPQVRNDAFAGAWAEKITKTAAPSPFWQYAGAAQIDTAIAQQVQAALVGQAKPKDAMTKAVEAVKPLLK